MIWPYAVAVVVFLFMILVHELGHFVAAKAMRVRVNEFSVGFGPALFKKRGRETLYCVRAIPFGGYCSMEGEDDESEDSRAYCNKPAWRRLVIILAGGVFNLLFGFILVMITLAPVKVYTTTTVAEFYDGAVSAQSGLRVGDRIIEVDGRHIFTSYDLSYNFTGIKGDSVDLVVRRDGKRVELNDVKFKTAEEDGINYISGDFYVYGAKRTFWNYLSQSFKTCISYSRVVLFSLVDLIRGRYGISQVSGPVGVTAVLGKAVRTGIMDLLPLIALISVNLGLFNLLPIPALDGGRALFLLVELVIRRPVPKRFEAVVHAAGFIIIIGFMIFITLKDILALF